MIEKPTGEQNYSAAERAKMQTDYDALLEQVINETVGNSGRSTGEGSDLTPQNSPETQAKLDELVKLSKILDNE